jgi:phosphohistidine phosphatase
VDKTIYEGSDESMLDLITGIDNVLESVMIFGHNPAITETANLFLHPRIGEMPTSAVVGIRFDTDKWERISMSASSKEFIIYPGLLKKP